MAYISVTKQTHGYTFHWTIENIYQSFLRKGERLDSPTFIADELEGTKWSLRLYPMGYEYKDYAGFFLYRDVDCSGPTDIEVNFQLAFIGKDGSLLEERTVMEHSFAKNRAYGFSRCVNRKKLFVIEKETFTPEDTLTVKGTIWKLEGNPLRVKNLYARTFFKENRRSFEWRIDKFRELKPDVSKKFIDGSIDFDLTLEVDKGLEKTFIISFNSLDESIKYFSVKSSIMDFGAKENCDFHEYFTDDLKKGKLYTQVFTIKLMKKSRRYYSIDVLFLDFEYVIPIKTAFYESFAFGKNSPKLTNNLIENRKDESLNKSMLVSDLKFLYEDPIFSDTELRTSTQTFPAHKNILSARSPVFRSMFTSDMKEKNSGHVDITDFEEDTVHRMLLYIYTDNLEDMRFESASNLYTIADKYEILSLKSRCSSFLKDNLCPENACDALVLADLHNDDDLKSAVQDYILGKRKQIFCSQEWKHFMDTHLKLAADVMYKKIYEE